MHDDRSATPLVQPAVRRPTFLSETSSRSSSPDSTSSASHARWERLRQHVLPSTRQGHTQQPSSISSTTHPARPQTPKPSRLARFGLRHVVEQAREAEDMSQRFADDIQKACYSSRYTEHAKGSRLEREAMSSSMPHLPAVSTPASFAATNPSVIGLPATTHWGSGSRGFYGLQANSSNTRPIPALLIILRNASYTGVPFTYLPHETLVLSALLTPFLTLEAVGGIAEERISAVEAFEIAMTHWKAETTEVRHSLCL
jgi:hypothetical protein